MNAYKYFKTWKWSLVVVLTLTLVVWGISGVTDLALAKKGGGGGGKGGEVAQEIPVRMTFNAGSIQSDGGDYIDGELKKKVTAIVGRNFSIVLETNNSNKTTAGQVRCSAL